MVLKKACFFSRSLGYNYGSDGTIEKQDKYLKRMSGFMRLYAAIMVTQTVKGSTQVIVSTLYYLPWIGWIVSSGEDTAWTKFISSQILLIQMLFSLIWCFQIALFSLPKGKYKWYIWQVLELQDSYKLHMLKNMFYICTKTITNTDWPICLFF